MLSPSNEEEDSSSAPEEGNDAEDDADDGDDLVAGLKAGEAAARVQATHDESRSEINWKKNSVFINFWHTNVIIIMQKT